MKRILAGMLALAAMLALLACGGNDQPAAPAAPAATGAAPAGGEAAAPAGTNAALNFTLVNATGYDIKELYLAPASANTWEENMVTGGQVLANGSSLPITFSGYNSSVSTCHPVGMPSAWCTAWGMSTR